MRTVPGLLAALALVAGTAAAQQLWYQHYEAGLQAAEEGAWEEALGYFERAAALEPQARDRVRTYGREFLFDYDPDYQRARCLVELGRQAEARDALARSRSAGVTAPEALEELARRLASAPPPPVETGRLRVRSTPPGAGVEIDGRLRGATPWSETGLTAGRHRVTVSLDGYETWQGRLQIRPDEPVLLEVGLVPVGSLVPGADAATRSDPADALEPAGLEAAAGARTPQGAGSERASRGSVREEDTTSAGGPSASGEARAEPGANGGPAGPSAGGEARPDLGANGGPADSSAGGDEAADRRSSVEGSDPTIRPDDDAAGDLEASGEGAPATGSGAGPGGEGGRDAALGGRTGGSGGARPGTRSLGDGAQAQSADRPGGRWLPAVLLGALLLALALVAARRFGQGDASGHPGERRSLWRLTTRGRRVGGYEVMGELGRGGMATTYRARRVSDGKEVALKIPHESGDPTYGARFLREAKLGESLHHPGIVRILDAGEDAGLLYLAMELLPGRTLRQALDERDEPLPVATALELARAIAEALDYAHSKGVVHRDLKPENVMLLPDGDLKVMDFGVAQIQGQPGLTASRFFFGSPVYAAPEMVTPLEADHRADLYSLGVILFELLEGRPPYYDESVYRLLELHQKAPLPGAEDLPRALPPALYRLLERLLAKQPADRQASAQELLVEIDRLLYAATPGADSEVG